MEVTGFGAISGGVGVRVGVVFGPSAVAIHAFAGPEAALVSCVAATVADEHVETHVELERVPTPAIWTGSGMTVVVGV